MARFIAGWVVAVGLLWLCWATMAPVVATAVYQPPKPQHICPMRKVQHIVRCPPPHTVTTNKVRCLFTVETDRCSL